MPDLAEDPQLGLVSPQWRGLGGLVVPLGTVDRPREQRRDTLTVNLGGASGHVAVVGGPRSGKSTLLRTIVTSMSLTTTPQESQFFVLDFGGGTFAPLAGLPHVAGVGTRSEPDVVRRIVAEVQGVVDRREAYFRANGIDSIETYRARRAAGRADDGYGDVFLVVDGWSTLRADFDDLEIELQQLADPRPDLRPAHRRRRRPLGGLPGRDARHLRHPARAAARRPDGLRDRPQDRRARPDRPSGSRAGAGQAALPRRPAPDRRRPPTPATSATASTTWSSGCRPPGRARPGPSCGCSRTGSTSTRSARQAELRPAAPTGCCCSASTRRSSRRSALDADAEPHLLRLRRRAVRQERGAAGLRAGGHAHPHAEGGADRRRRLPALAARRGARRVPAQLPDLRHPGAAGAARPGAATSRTASPAPTSPPTSCATARGGRAPRCSWSSTTTTWSPPSRARRCRRCSRCWRRPATSGCTSRSRGARAARRARSTSPCIQSLRDLAMPGPAAVGQPRRGPADRQPEPQPAPPGRGRLVTRDRGVEVVQMAWTERSQCMPVAAGRPGYRWSAAWPRSTWCFATGPLQHRP